MLFTSLHFLLQDNMDLSKSDVQECPDHIELTERLRKTLYYGKAPNMDRPSLSVTEVAVEFLQDAAPRQLGRVDNYVASSVGKKACVSPCSMMLGMLYIERLKHRNPEYLQQVSSSDLFLVAMMVASKYLYDEGVDEEVFNDEWAESAKMDIEELNDLERTFLAAIDWNLYVKPEDFWKVLGNVERRIAQDQSKDRGYFTYSDLDVLSNDRRVSQTVHQMAGDVGRVLMVCSVAYVAGALTLVTAPMALTLVKTQLPPVALFPILPVTLTLTPNLPISDLETSVESSLESSLQSSTPNNDVQDVGSEEEEISVKPSRPSLTSFLTLVLVKDTVLQFVAAVKDRVKGYSPLHGDVMDSNPGENVLGDVVCRCGLCHTVSETKCLNMTASHCEHARKMWTWKRETQDSRSKEVKDLRKNCRTRACLTRPTSHMTHATLTSRQTTFNSGLGTFQMNSHCDCCCCCPSSKLKNLNKDQSGLLDRKLRVFPSFADVTIGFGTSVHARTAAAG